MRFESPCLAKSARHGAPPGTDHAPREAQLNRLHHGGRSALLRFTDQKMEVLRHHDASENNEAVPCTHLLQSFEEEIAQVRCAQERLPMIATAGDEVQVAGAVVALEIFWHSQKCRWACVCLM